ncbi:hypothetical protein B484DRAFT_403390 [Ochromonadaceae sp. CCMP2298]|nr:hypothetical protein B484DRAFT_403390 [Ochromonadaceae sp. CCMP2298]
MPGSAVRLIGEVEDVGAEDERVSARGALRARSRSRSRGSGGRPYSRSPTRSPSPGHGVGVGSAKGVGMSARAEGVEAQVELGALMLADPNYVPAVIGTSATSPRNASPHTPATGAEAGGRLSPSAVAGAGATASSKINFTDEEPLPDHPPTHTQSLSPSPSPSPSPAPEFSIDIPPSPNTPSTPISNPLPRHISTLELNSPSSPSRKFIGDQSELLRLTSALQLESQEMESEADCLDVIAASIRAVERMKFEAKEKTSYSEHDTDQERASTAQQEKNIREKARNLEDDLRISVKSLEDTGGMKHKIKSLQEKLRKEKVRREKFVAVEEGQNKKFTVLISHMERVMKALKIESAKTVKALEVNRRMQKEAGVVQGRVEKQERVIAVQNRHVQEIAEGSRILQDQLALMDDRYLDLRNRLDTARNTFGTSMTKMSREVSDLRAKYSQATHGKLLDTEPRRRPVTGSGGSRPRSAAVLGRAASGVSGVTGVNSDYNAAVASRRWTPMDSIGMEFEQEQMHPFKNKALDLFIGGMSRNTKFMNASSPLSETKITKKIMEKQKKSQTDGWSKERLEELIHS